MTTANMQMLPGLMYGLPIEGVIRNGAVEGTEPVALDEFILTAKIKDAEGSWVRHPMDHPLRDQYGVDELGVKKLRRIPIVVAFDSTALTLHEQYAAFSRDGRALCAGDGNRAKRRILLANGNFNVETCACPGSRSCGFGQSNGCDLLMRLKVRIDGQSDMAGLFILRSGSINGVTECRAFLEHLRAMLGDRLAGVPLWLTLEPKQSAASNHEVFWHVSLRPRFESLVVEATAMKQRREAEAAVGLCRDASEKRLLSLMSNGAFADDAAEDAEQFQELLTARFVSSGVDGESDGQVVTVRSSADGLHQLSASSGALSAISQIYSSAASGVEPMASAMPSALPVVHEGLGDAVSDSSIPEDVPPPWEDASAPASTEAATELLSSLAQESHDADRQLGVTSSQVAGGRGPLPIGRVAGSAQVVRLPFSAGKTGVRRSTSGLGAFELLSASRRTGA